MGPHRDVRTRAERTGLACSNVRPGQSLPCDGSGVQSAPLQIGRQAGRVEQGRHQPENRSQTMDMETIAAGSTGSYGNAWVERVSTRAWAGPPNLTSPFLSANMKSFSVVSPGYIRPPAGPAVGSVIRRLWPLRTSVLNSWMWLNSPALVWPPLRGRSAAPAARRPGPAGRCQ